MSNKLLDQNTADQIKELLAEMQNPIKVKVFTKDECEHCALTVQLFEELNVLNDNITLKIFDVNKDNEVAKKYNVEDAPAYIILNEAKPEPTFVFYGVPAGHEINTLLTHLIDMSVDAPLFDDAILETLKNVDSNVNIKVFVTTSCPHCPGAAINASRLSLVNSNIKAEIYEASSFFEMSEKYEVSGVPKIVINETESIMGNQPINAYLDIITKL